MGQRPHTPKEVARELRKEAGFGCANCGDPFVVYHHIVEYHLEQHFDPKRMVAICPSCHDRFHRMPKEKQYRIKQNPRNLRSGLVRGALEFKESLAVIEIGGNQFVDCPKLIGFNGAPLLSWRREHGEFLLSVRLKSADGQDLLHIEDNEFQFMPNNLWDVVFRYNFFRIQSASRRSVVEFDLRRSPVRMKFKAMAGRQMIGVDSKSLSVGPFNYAGCVFHSIGGFCVHMIGRDSEGIYGSDGGDAMKLVI